MLLLGEGFDLLVGELELGRAGPRTATALTASSLAPMFAA